MKYRKSFEEFVGEKKETEKEKRERIRREREKKLKRIFNVK